ncbi:MAG: DUF4398 domain-containing protein [Elusimicrobiales bacterium]
MKSSDIQLVLLLAGISGLSGCVSTSRYTLRESPAPISSISIETKRQKTFPATKWLSKSSGWDSKYTDDQFVGRILALPFYPITFLIDSISLAHKTTYTTAYNFKGTILLDGQPYPNKTFSLSGPIAGNLQTDSNGGFEKTFSESDKAYRKPISYTTLQLEFAQAADLASGATVSMVVPLAIELTLNDEGKELRIENRKDLVPYLNQSKDLTTRDAIATEWKRTDTNKPVNLTTQSFYSDKNRQITSSEELEAAKRRQEEETKAEMAKQDAQRLREKAEADKAKRCAAQSKRTKGKHLCSTGKLIEFAAGQNVPDAACIYYEEAFQPTPYSFSVLSLTPDGCLYFLGHSKIGSIPQNTDPIHVYKYGNPNEDAPVPEGIHPVHWRKNIHATCGNLDLPLPYGYYEYTGEYSYTALRGNSKKVYSFEKLDVDADCLE